MKRVEMTEEVEQSLRTLQGRNFIFKKRFYKQNDRKELPSFFHMGTVVESKTGVRELNPRMKGNSIAE